jgi:hypothetical protein
MQGRDKTPYNGINCQTFDESVAVDVLVGHCTGGIMANRSQYYSCIQAPGSSPKGNSEVRGFQGENFAIFDSGIRGFEAKILETHSKLGGLRAGWRSKKNSKGRVRTSERVQHFKEARHLFPSILPQN